MPKELKIIFLILFGLPILAFSLLVFKTSQPDPTASEIKGLESTPPAYNLGDIPRLEGFVLKEYVLKNTTDQPMKLSRITTSCMCTKTKAIVDGKETAFFGMESQGDKNAPVNLEIKSGQEIKIIFQFDPNAHGPKGIGPIDRSVSLIFSNPKGTKELKFSGNVIEK